MKEKKKFIIPEIEVVTFTNDDIITGSGGDWGADDNHEEFGFGEEE